MENDDKKKFTELMKPYIESGEDINNFCFSTTTRRWDIILVECILVYGNGFVKSSVKFANKAEKYMKSIPKPNENPKLITEIFLMNYLMSEKKYDYKKLLIMLMLLESIWKYSFLLPKDPSRIREIWLQANRNHKKPSKNN